MEDYWNKIQSKFIETGQYPQQMYGNQQQPIVNNQTIPKANANVGNSQNIYYPYQESDFQNPPAQSDQNSKALEKFDGIIEPNASNQGHYGFEKEGEIGIINDLKLFFNENMDSYAKWFCGITTVIWIIIMILIFKQI